MNDHQIAKDNEEDHQADVQDLHHVSIARGNGGEFGLPF